VIIRIKSVLYLFYLYLKTHFHEYRRWHFRRNENLDFRVFYGHYHIPLPDERASGGIIKCQDLQRLYPNTKRGANILYLVSSALPHFAPVMVRYARENGVKLIVNQNGVAIPAYHGKKLEEMNGPRRFLLHEADCVIYQSRFCQESSDVFIGCRERPFEILYNPVDVEAFVPVSHQLISRAPTLLLAGSHHHYYRVLSAIEILAELVKRGEKISLTIAGRLVWKDDDQVCVRELARMCNDLGVSDCVHILGPYSQSDAVSIFQEADILLQTQYMDSCPRVVVEAMACGLPIVYSHSGGVPELVGENAGVGVPVPHDWNKIHAAEPEQMATAVSHILSSYETFSRAARQRAVTNFDVRPWLDKHREIFESLLLS